MIAEAEIRRCAARWGVDPMVADLVQDIPTVHFEAAWQTTLETVRLALTDRAGSLRDQTMGPKDLTGLQSQGK